MKQMPNSEKPERNRLSGWSYVALSKYCITSLLSAKANMRNATLQDIIKEINGKPGSEINRERDGSCVLLFALVSTV